MDEFKFLKEEFLGKEVIIYPGDSYKKTGIIKDINSAGVTFKITAYSGNDNQYERNKLTFISFTKLTFKEI